MFVQASQPSQEMDSVEPESSQFGTQAAKRYVDAMSEQVLFVS